MSRTRKGSKGPGWEYWSRRPCSGWNPGKETKRITHQIERAREKELIQEEIREWQQEQDTEDTQSIGRAAGGPTPTGATRR